MRPVVPTPRLQQLLRRLTNGEEKLLFESPSASRWAFGVIAGFVCNARAALLGGVCGGTLLCPLPKSMLWSATAIDAAYFLSSAWRRLTSASTSSGLMLLTLIGPAQISRHGAPANACRTITSKTCARTPEP